MNNSKEFIEWQKDLIFLAQIYNITSAFEGDEPDDLIAQILHAARSVPAEIEEKLGEQTGSSLAYFLKTAAESLIKLQDMLKISLNLNLISISEYHSLLVNLNEIGEIIKKFVLKINSNQKHRGKKLSVELDNFARCTLN